MSTEQNCIQLSWIQKASRNMIDHKNTPESLSNAR